MKHAQIFMAFFRAGMLGYGGGPASIPLILAEVKRYGWMDDDEFSDILAIGNTLPGPIATKMAGYIGYRVGGILGMLNAIVASVFPTVVLMIILLVSLASFRDYPWVQGMTNGVVPVVAVMLGALTWGFIKRSKQDFGWMKVIILLIGSILLIEIFGIHPALVILALLLFVFFRKPEKEQLKKEGETE
ncbi:chromate transporter [Evansella sp. LMS18]|uniref:chromate transporter n=1 Tax=Evansella sp. LMS18 TaxID=2924033 RepID=UPI0020D0F797|nr:chromate transporter [Evansella sp. LMS18]UTR09048.1 chromate transporter [Evansella sp. LMS18]